MITLPRRATSALLVALVPLAAAAPGFSQDQPVSPPPPAAAPEAILPPVLVTAPPALSSSSEQLIPGKDFELRPQGRPADVLRLIPGLIINQHQGGGKAEQYLIRGFDADHGTDLARYRYKNLDAFLSIENLTNTQWREAQFFFTSRLRGEPAGGVDNIHFTPGTPRSFLGGIALHFRPDTGAPRSVAIPLAGSAPRRGLAGGEAGGEKALLARVVDQAEGGAVLGGRLREAPEPPEEVGAGGG